MNTNTTPPPLCHACGEAFSLGVVESEPKRGLCGRQWHGDCMSSKLCPTCSMPLTTQANENQVAERRQRNQAQAWNAFLAGAAGCWFGSLAMVVVLSLAHLALGGPRLAFSIFGLTLQGGLLGAHALCHFLFCQTRRLPLARWAAIAGFPHSASLVADGLSLDAGGLSNVALRLLFIPAFLYAAYLGAASYWTRMPQDLKDGMK